jgi:CRP-like cAMP-binding protein
VDVVRDKVARKRPSESGLAAPAGPDALRAYGPGLSASPLFEGFSEDELLAIIRGLRLLSFEPGGVIVTEGEPGQSLFVLTTGAVNVSVRDEQGRDVRLCRLDEGSFFGEISTLSGRPRTATIVAASDCELLELDKPNLERIIDIHPRVKEILEEVYLMRSGDTARALGETPPRAPSQAG